VHVLTSRSIPRPLRTIVGAGLEHPELVLVPRLDSKPRIADRKPADYRDQVKCQTIGSLSFAT